MLSRLQAQPVKADHGSNRLDDCQDAGRTRGLIAEKVPAAEPFGAARDLNDGCIYVFVRQDLALQDQLGAHGHAIERLMILFRPNLGLPSIITIGIPHAKSMDRVQGKVRDNNLPYLAWIDPDFKELGVTSIATYCETENEREVLRNYRLYDPRANSERTPVLHATAALDGERGANADVAQLREHSVSNGGVVGENPSIGSNLAEIQ